MITLTHPPPLLPLAFSSFEFFFSATTIVSSAVFVDFLVSYYWLYTMPLLTILFPGQVCWLYCLPFALKFHYNSWIKSNYEKTPSGSPWFPLSYSATCATFLPFSVDQNDRFSQELVCGLRHIHSLTWEDCPNESSSEGTDKGSNRRG